MEYWIKSSHDKLFRYKKMQEEQLSIFLHGIQYKLKILAAAFNVDSYQPMKQFNQAEGWYFFHRQWEGQSCLIVILW